MLKEKLLYPIKRILLETKYCPKTVYRHSYSQCGEDLIVDFIFRSLNIKSIFYLDIGAYHPTNLSNTYFFYQQGHAGICVEPDYLRCRYFQKKRKRDMCLNTGIGSSDNEIATFFVLDSQTLSTFSKQEADRYCEYGHKIVNTVSVPILSINKLLDLYCNKTLNFVSIDIEGLDLEVVKNFDFNAFRPEVFCIETLTYSNDHTNVKITSIIDFMHQKGYFSFADTYINTIFVDKSIW